MNTKKLGFGLMRLSTFDAAKVFCFQLKWHEMVVFRE